MADLDQKQSFCLSKTRFFARKSLENFVRIFFRKNSNGLFKFGFSFENQFQDMMHKHALKPCSINGKYASKLCAYAIMHLLNLSIMLGDNSFTNK